MTIDTLAAAKTLAEAGMENGQAEAVANVVRDATADLATKADLDALERRLDDKFATMDERIAINERVTGERIAASERGTAERITASERGTAKRIAANERVTGERIAANERGTAEKIAAAETRLHAELKSGLAELRADFYRWMWVMGASIVGILLTAITLSLSIAVA